jgi:hypothetical protein
VNIVISQSQGQARQNKQQRSEIIFTQDIGVLTHKNRENINTKISSFGMIEHIRKHNIINIETQSIN